MEMESNMESKELMQIQAENAIRTEKSAFWSFRSFRFWMAFLLAAGYTASAMQKLGLGIAIVCMVNGTWLNQNQNTTNLQNETLVQSDHVQCVLTESQKISYEGEFKWNRHDQALLFAVPYIGTLIVCLLSGWLSDHYGGCLVLSVGNSIGLLATLLTPFAAFHLPFFTLVIFRALVGVSQGMYKSGVGRCMADWFPPFEISVVVAFYTAGNQIAVAILNPIAPYLCALKHLWGGWSLIFLTTASFTLCWLFVWNVAATDSPMKNRFMNYREKRFLESNLASSADRKNKSVSVVNRTPWLAVCTSSCVWAVVYADLVHSFIFYTVQVYIPTYFRDVLMFDLKQSQNGFLSVLPFMFGLTFKFIWSSIADKLKKMDFVSNSTICRAFNTIGNIIAFLCLLSLSYLDCEHSYLAVAILCLFFIGCGFIIPGYLTSAVSIAPKHAGVVTSFVTFGEIGGFLGPYALARIVQNGSAEEWRSVFQLMSGLICSSTIVFAVFGRADPQEWAL